MPLVVQEDLVLEQLDVSTSFLHGELEEEIFMTPPEGFVRKGDEDKVYLLKRSLCGLKQSPRQWYKRFDSFTIKIGFNRKNEHDSCVYWKKTVIGELVFPLLYVDDMLVACKSKEEIKRVKKMLESKFEMKDMGAANKILGMQIVRNRIAGSLIISQKIILRRC